MSGDAEAIRDPVENRVVWRDAGDWRRFAAVWHDDGVMMATWFQGPAAYIQTRIGYDVKRDMPGLTGPEVEDLYARGAAWLSGPRGVHPARHA